MIGDDLRNSNPFVFLLVIIIAGIAVFGKSMAGAFNGRTYKQRRSLAKARAAKRRKRRVMGKVRAAVRRSRPRKRKRVRK
jgi:hypothetical protein